ncbi:RNA-binding NOB1-like protein isoform X2 [Gastrolobium bilobum]|uniref:RNA-binding NOB1-like protein isoform X2 n=1 Tax=Gastrolobium bilobum TaxID=150636 RepID=UPI002AB0B54C|nr:RNA-binding NOB1-like protein isoform X2 [Gastrolobium bilobum]
MEEPPLSVSGTPTATASCWSNVVKKQPPQQESLQNERVLEETFKSINGISVAVIDANAVIDAGDKLHSFADKFVSVPEVMEEIRDPVSRHKLSFLPFTIQTMEPSPEAINKVIKFARATGDLQTLSDVDIKLIALTYTLEAQVHGTKHLRDIPPPVQMVNVKRLPEKDMPGWGSNVPNLQEWEALEHDAEDKSNSNSRILPLQDLNLNIVPQDDHTGDGLVEHTSETPSEIQEGGSRKPKKYLPEKKEINIEGTTMVADGIDASQGQFDDNAGDWLPAVSRSTHRRYLRRKARREYHEVLSSNQDQQDMEENIDGSVREDARTSNQLVHHEENKDSESVSAILKQMRLEEGSLEVLDEEHRLSLSPEELQTNNGRLQETTSDGNSTIATEPCKTDTVNDLSNDLEIASQTTEAADFSYADDDGSEQSWMLRSLSESSVACVTSDFAMQNVLLQMGLRLLAPGGSQIHQLHRWILKCHACYAVTAEIGRIFCPKCGNGGTLRKVAVTVNENGIMLAARRPRVTLRGTKFSLPLPQGGRDAVTKNLILREDQLPQRVLYPKTKKKTNKQDDDFFTPDNVFGHHTDKKAFQPPIRKALAAFSGRRNPNDNHFSRNKHK